MCQSASYDDAHGLLAHTSAMAAAEEQQQRSGGLDPEELADRSRDEPREGSVAGGVGRSGLPDVVVDTGGVMVVGA